MDDYSTLLKNLVSIASETYRFETVFEKAISKLDYDERTKYISQYAWFSKKVNSALTGSGLRIVELRGQLYDPGMAVTPLNLEEFGPDEKLYIYQMVEPLIMKDDTVMKLGTVILGRKDD